MHGDKASGAPKGNRKAWKHELLGKGDGAARCAETSG